METTIWIWQYVITDNGEVNFVMIDSEAYSHWEKMMKLREELLSVEEGRISGKTGYSLDELDSYLNNIIDES